jgi:hypothetical protein
VGRVAAGERGGVVVESGYGATQGEQRDGGQR